MAENALFRLFCEFVSGIKQLGNLHAADGKYNVISWWGKSGFQSK